MTSHARNKNTNGHTATVGNGEHRNHSGDSVERIRDIIFGEQIQDYSAKFEQIWTQFSAVDQRLESIHNKLAEHERDIDSQLEQQRKKFDAALKQLDSDFSQQLADAAVETQQKADALNKTIVALSKSTKKDLKKATEQLADLKMDRASLGEMFLHLGQSLLTNGVQQETASGSSEQKK